MSFTYGFYNSKNGDRMYDAAQFGSIFDGVINDGIYMSQGNQFIVKAGSGLDVNVGTGRAWFNHTWCLNDSVYPLTLNNADILDPRIDAVVIETNSDINVRATSIKVLTGTPAERPRKPTMTHTATVDQYPLAYITVPANATTITQYNIENAVGTSATPFVTGVIQTMNIDALITQWQAQWQEYIVAREEAMDTWTDAEKAAFVSWENDTKDEIRSWMTDMDSEVDTWYAAKRQEFNTWFENLVYVLDGDVAGHLQNEIDEFNTTVQQLETDIYKKIDDEAEKEFNRYYGLEARTTAFNLDGSITETTSEMIATTTFPEPGKVVVNLLPTSGDWKYTKTTTISSTEVVENYVKERRN